MADTIKIGNLDISSFKVGSGDCKVYLGNTLLYPLGEPSFKWKATYSDSSVTSAECDASSAIVQGEIPGYDEGRNFIRSVEVGDCVTELGESLFLSQSSLTALTMSDTVISIGDSAFYNCSNITNIKISANLETIGEGAFEGIRFSNAITLGNVITIGYDAFRYCDSLPSVKIGDKITSIGGRAFNNCTGLTSVIIEATTPPTLSNSNAFSYTNDCPILVPSQSVSAYKTASVWSSLASRIQAIPNS